MLDVVLLILCGSRKNCCKVRDSVLSLLKIYIMLYYNLIDTEHSHSNDDSKTFGPRGSSSAIKLTKRHPLSKCLTTVP